tara:strand:- start:638 stop:970 length:333 start_codon:yes stop_codon:yes gene_type:complete
VSGWGHYAPTHRIVYLLDSVEVREIVNVRGRTDESDTLHGELSLATIGAIFDDGPVAVLLDGLTHVAESSGGVLDPELGSHLTRSDALAFSKVRDDLTLRGVVVHVNNLS